MKIKSWIQKIYGKTAPVESKPLKIYQSVSADIVASYNERRPLGPQEKLCYAPFKNMYFGHSGKVIACCYNRNHVFGIYPEKSIKEIWFGSAAEQLREYISHNDLTLGCAGCQEQIVAGNIDATKAKQYDELPLNTNLYPSVLEFELSNVCNLECTMCSGDFSSLIRKNKENRPPLPNPYDDAFVEQLREFIPHLTEVKFYGGEPFLIDIYYQIWDLIIELKPSIRVSVQTNATILNNRVKTILDKTNFHINISFDSIVKENYEAIRVNANYDRVMENIQYFRAYTKQKGTFFGISTCAMRQNWQELPDMIRFCNDMDCPAYFHTIFFPEDHALYNLPKDILETILAHYLKQSFPENNPVQIKNKQHFNDIIKQLKKWINDNSHEKVIISVTSMDDFRNIVCSHILQNEAIDLMDRSHIVEQINAKLDAIVAVLGPEKTLNRLQGMDLSNKMLLNNIAMALSNDSLDNLVGYINSDFNI
jgi:MoaA/NifB/PqqE/SkfB family radical SAM enzyme